MRKALFVVSTILLLAGLACGFNLSTANISQAQMARDEEGNDPTTVFNQDDVFYAVIQLENAPDDTALKAVWAAVDADDTEPNFMIDEVEITAGSGSVNFNLTNDKLWPVGDYKVDIYLNDELDRTLEFEVEGEVVAEQPEEPTPTPEPSPTPEPEPTNTPQETSGDSLGGSSGGDSLGEADEEEEAEEVEAEPIPFKADPYVHPSGAFTFAVPETFEGIDGDETSVIFGDDNSTLGAAFLNTDTIYTEDQVIEFIGGFLGGFFEDIDPDYEVTYEDNSLAESGFVYESVDFAGGDSRADFFFDQRDTILFVFYFVSNNFEEMDPTWNAILGTYDIDGEAALEAAPGPEPTPQPQPAATPTPAPAANPFVPPSGVARVFMQNFYGSEYNIDFGDGSGSIAVMPGVQNFYHDVAPGKYNPGLSLPGGGATNVEFEIQANEAFLIIVTEDLGVRWGKVYP
jgi:hypothetical protein